jgi:DNA-binding CsgD family transcriptional regulator
VERFRDLRQGCIVSAKPDDYALGVPPIVGRESEIAVVDAFLQNDRGAGVLAVVGEAGIGKTTVWEHAVLRARESDAAVLVARPAESEAKLSFAGLTDLLSPVPPDLAAALPGPQREAIDVVLLKAEAARPPGRRLVGTAVLSILRALAADRAVVLAVDDVHWLDGSSASAVEFAIRRLADEPVRTIVSLRPEAERTGLVGLVADCAERLELGPLSVAALHRIIAQALGRTFPRPTLVRIARASGGNPFYALEIARLLGRDGGPRGAETLPVPEDLRALVAERVASLPARTRAALLRAAALARPDLSLVDARAIAAAEEAGLVRLGADGRVEFAHPLYASAVYASAPLSRRRAMHRALADQVADPEERARHLALGCARPDEGAAAAVEEAARRARMRGAPDAAAELVELALRLTPEGAAEAGERRLALAEHLQVAGDYERATGLLEQLAEVESGDLRARALLALAEIDFWGKGESVATALAEEALRAARDPVVQARAQAAIALYGGTVDLPKASAAARAALDLLGARPDADPGLVATALGALVRARLFLGEGFDAEAAERALALEAASPPSAVDTRIAFKLGQWLRYVDDLDGARERLEQCERTAREEGDESSLANIFLNRLVVECWAGNWQEATEFAERMGEAFDQRGVESEGVGPWLAYVDAHAGRLEAVRTAAGRFRPEEPIVEMIWNRCLGLAELAAGDAEASDRHLSAAMVELERVDFREPAVWRVDGDAIEAAIAVGDLARAEALAKRFEQQAARSRIPWSLAVSARCRGLVLAARGQTLAAEDALERALAAHARCPMPFERARTLLARGLISRRLKHKREARAALEEASAIFRRLGADAWAHRAEAELERVAVRRAPSDLSPTELRIASLAATGLTNQAIAVEVFLTRKAVEANLARAYRKLGIRSRAQLSRALDARDARLRA